MNDTITVNVRRKRSRHVSIPFETERVDYCAGGRVLLRSLRMFGGETGGSTDVTIWRPNRFPGPYRTTAVEVPDDEAHAYAMSWARQIVAEIVERRRSVALLHNHA